jgi:hypothetical protein
MTGRWLDSFGSGYMLMEGGCGRANEYSVTLRWGDLLTDDLQGSLKDSAPRA